MKKIAVFSSDMGRGGTQRVLASIANYLIEDCDVDLLLLQRTGQYLPEFKESINVISFNSSRSIFSIFKLIKYLQENKPYKIIASMEHLHFIATLAIILSGSSTKAIFRLPSSPSYIYTTKKHPTLYKKIQFKILRVSLSYFYNLKLVEAIVTPSLLVKDDFNSYYTLKQIKKIKVIPNPIDLDFLDDVVEEQINYFKNDYPLVVSMQRFEDEKDNITLLKSINEVLKTRRINFILLGEGSHESLLRKVISDLKIEENVCLPGFLSNPFPILKNANAFVLSSFAEGMPNSLLQAMYLGIPVIATDCNFGPREILEDGKWGALVEVGDFKRMSEKIINALDGELKNMPKEYFAEKYSAKNIVGKYLNINE